MTKLEALTAIDLSKKILSKEVSSLEVTEYFLELAEKKNGRTNSFVTITSELAFEKAKFLDNEITKNGPVGKIHGIPVGIKDLGDSIGGVRSTFGSTPLRNFVAAGTTSYVKSIMDAGGVVIGKTNSPEFGHKGITDNFVTGATATPFDLTRNAGGSSGGSAAAVADGLVPFAQGSDGGGSVRIPSSWCGTYAIKPSFGRIPEIASPNAFALSSPFVGIGPIARTVSDAALLLQVMQGNNDMDPFSLPNSEMDLSKIEPIELKNLKIAYTPDFGGFPIDNEVKIVINAALETMSNAGAEINEVKIKFTKSIFELAELWVRLMALLYVDAMENFKTLGYNLIEEHSDELSPDFVKMVKAVNSQSAVETREDLRTRTMVYNAVIGAMKGFDFLISPTLALPPVKNSPNGLTRVPNSINGIDIEHTIGWCLTFPTNFTGNPVASIPAGFTKLGLPIGMQIVGRRHRDDQVLGLSKTIEDLLPWYNAYPYLKI